MSETHEKGINVLRSRLAQKKPEDNKKSFKYNTTQLYLDNFLAKKSTSVTETMGTYTRYGINSLYFESIYEYCILSCRKKLHEK